MKKQTDNFYVDNPFQSPSILAIGPGLLGLERGLQRAIGRIRVAAYVEIEAFIIENLLTGMEAGVVDAAPVWADIKTFQAKAFRNKIHIVTAGYPCQPFSTAGLRLGHADPRHIFPYILGVLQSTGSVCAYFENVSGHLSMGYDQVYKDLRSIGYAVEAGVYTAEEVGAPHERERIFILAIRQDFLSNAQRFFRHSGREHAGWEAWTNINWSSKRAKMGNSHSDGDQGGLLAAGINGIEKSIEGENGQWQRLRTEPVANGKTTSQQLAYTYCQPVAWECATGIRKMSAAHATDSGRNGRQPDRANGANGGNKKNAKTMAHTLCHHGEQVQTEAWITKFRHEPVLTGTAWGDERWPSPPGQQQYAWEEPRTINARIALPNAVRKMGRSLWKGYKKILSKEERKKIEEQEYATIESGMGFSINGYNFREDLLRASGNSVVEQAAAFAFIDLLETHFKNAERANTL
jgi:site-specific DNA-cytosine methylase